MKFYATLSNILFSQQPFPRIVRNRVLRQCLRLVSELDAQWWIAHSTLSSFSSILKFPHVFRTPCHRIRGECSYCYSAKNAEAVTWSLAEYLMRRILKPTKKNLRGLSPQASLNIKNHVDRTIGIFIFTYAVDRRKMYISRFRYASLA
jgi:hypothetical protein